MQQPHSACMRDDRVTSRYHCALSKVLIIYRYVPNKKSKCVRQWYIYICNIWRVVMCLFELVIISHWSIYIYIPNEHVFFEWSIGARKNFNLLSSARCVLFYWMGTVIVRWKWKPRCVLTISISIFMHLFGWILSVRCPLNESKKCEKKTFVPIGDQFGFASKLIDGRDQLQIEHHA